MKNLKDLSPSSLRIRKTVWRRVKEDLIKRIEADPNGRDKIGLCQSVKNAIRATSGAPCDHHLPEFLEKKPKKGGTAWWWNPYRPSSRKRRIRVVNEILAEIDSLLEAKK